MLSLLIRRDRRHLFSDLMPWTCVEPACADAAITFNTRESWIQHLEFDHEYGPAWESRTCLLCNEETGNGLDNCSRHLLSHLEEISLAALPRTADEESHQSDMTSSTASAAQLALDHLEVGAPEEASAEGKQHFVCRAGCGYKTTDADELR